jgi:predicted Zn-dependent protease
MVLGNLWKIQMNKLLSVLIIVFIILNGLMPASVESADLSKAEEESRIGHLFDLYMTESFVMLRDESLSEKIQSVVNRIMNAAEKSDYNIRLRIINEQLPVVSSFPGYVYVSSGMLDILESESELAFTIAHAIAHTINNDQNESYNNVLRKERIAGFMGHIMPLLVFSGVGGAAIAGAGATAASASMLEGAVVVESGIYSTATLADALTASDNLETNNINNLFIPYINLPDTKQSLSVMVFLSDVYVGYGEKEEIQADDMAISYIVKAGYDANTIVPVLEKIKELRNDYIVSGDISHLMLANPGLEKRIDNAGRVLEKN